MFYKKAENKKWAARHFLVRKRAEDLFLRYVQSYKFQVL